MNTVDIAPLVKAFADAAIPVIGMLIYYLLQGHLKDTAARTAVLGAIENGVQFGMNKVDGALAGKPLNVQIGSDVAAHAVRYALDLVPDAAKRLDLSPTKLAKIAVAKLPGVEGAIGSDVIAGIAAAANGEAVKPVDMDDVTKALMTIAETINKRQAPAG